MSRDTRQIRFGDQVIDAVSLTDRRGRTLLAQLPARGAGGTLSDQGPELRECRVQVRWVKRHNDDDPAARRRALYALDDGLTRLFVHPEDGEFPAKMSIEDETREGGRITTGLRFVEDRGDPRHTRANAPAATVQSAVEAVLGRARAAGETLGAHALPTDVAADSAALARSWNAPSGPPAADVQTGVNRQTAAIRARLDESGASADPSRIDVYFALLDLSAALADAAEIVTARSSGGRGLVELRLHEPVTLLALAARLYGGAAARERAADILRLNPHVRDANAVPAHTTLVIPGA